MTATTDAKALYRAFLACLIVASLPIKNLAYVALALYLLILWLHGEGRVLGRVVVLSSAVLVLSCIAVLWDHLAGRTVNFPGVWLGVLTYAPFCIVLCETFGRTIDQTANDKFVKVCVWFILLQSVIGVLQFAATGNPDAVCGTFGLLDGFRQTITIAQVYFTFTIFGMILFLIPVARQWLPRIAIAIGVLICVLAQSGHQTIFFAATLVFCGMARVSHIGTLIRTVAGAAAITWLVLLAYPNTVWLAQEWYRKVNDAANSPKQVVLEGAASILEDPKNLFIGTGLGQYSSRAALITSGEYLNAQLPGFMTGKSDYFDDYIEPARVLFQETGEGSAIAQPFMTAMSVPVELGLVLTTVLFVVICRAVIRSIALMTRYGDEVAWIGFTMMVGIIFFVLCCFIENYAEFAQAVFAPFILFVVAGSRAQTVLRSAENGQSGCRVRVSQLPRTSYAFAATTTLPR